jgi:2-polyprenyl-3-methyl-5-hydroxy-6-metoxy-1,4-benzoquinol methylase
MQTLPTNATTSRDVPCPICKVPGTVYKQVGPATYYRCGACETLFQHPMPTLEAMRDYVEREYSSGVYSDYVSAAALKSLTFSARAARILRRTGPGRLLDVGASCGYFVDEALKAGFDAYGLELSSEAVASAPEPLRARLTIGDVNTLERRGESAYDVVTAFDIIEHTFNPVAFLESLRRVARPGSTIAITTPDTGHFLRYVLGARWPMLQPMQHTVLFSSRSLSMALAQAGFTDITVEPAYKTLTADYLAGQVAMYLPAAVRLYRSASGVVPAAIRERPVSINIGELLAFARVPAAG